MRIEHSVKEQVLQFLRSNPGMFYCRQCLVKLLAIDYAEMRNILPGVIVFDRRFEVTQGACEQCLNLRTIFRYRASQGTRSTR